MVESVQQKHKALMEDEILQGWASFFTSSFHLFTG
jgi:hypothetical protein